MPTKRPKPKWGHRSKGLLEDLGKEHYDEKQVSELVGLLAEGVSQGDLKQKLDIAANWQAPSILDTFQRTN